MLLTDASRKHQAAASRVRATACCSNRPTSTRRRPAREPDARPHARSTRSIPAKAAQGRHAARAPAGATSRSRSTTGGSRCSSSSRSTRSYVWVMDLATGERRRVLPGRRRDARAADRLVRTSISRATARGCSWRPTATASSASVAYLDLATGKLEYFGDGGNWDVEEIALSPDGRKLAVITNEGGVGVLRLYDAATRRALPQPAAADRRRVRGVVVAREFARPRVRRSTSAQSPGDVVRASTSRDNKVTRWTESEGRGARRDAVPRAPSRIEWKSFDGRTIGGFIVRPPANFTGKRPVMITIHGGPEAQARPGLHRPLELLRRRAGRRAHRAQRPRLDRLRQDVPRRSTTG